MFANLFGGAYKYQVGDMVHLGDGTQFLTVQWRGYLLIGPAGRRIRVPVYRLEEHWHWDCYYEDELYDISSLPF